MPTPKSSSPGRNLLFVLAGILAIILLLVFARRSAPSGSGATVDKQAPDKPRASRPPWAVSAPPEVLALSDDHEPDRSKVGLWMLEDEKLPLVAAESLINWRFPRGSLPLHPDMTDVLHPNRRSDSKMALHHKDGTVDVGLQVLFSGDKFSLFGNEPIAASFTVLKDDAPVAVNILGARALAVEPNSHRPLGPEAPLTMAETTPHVFTTTFRAPGTPLARHNGFIDLEVTFDPGDGKPSIATLDLFYQEEQQAPARFTGEVREELKDGSLALYVGVQVIEPGWYTVDANIFDATGKPLAMLAARLDLAQGHVEVPLSLYGRIIREQKPQAPFKVANLRGARMLVGQDPDRKLMADGAEYQTRPYKLEDFTDAEYWDAQKEARIRNLLSAAEGEGPGMLRRTVADAKAQGWAPHW